MTKEQVKAIYREYKEGMEEYHEMIAIYEGLENETLEVLGWYEAKIVEKETHLNKLKEIWQLYGV